MSECDSSGVLEPELPELPSLTRLLVLLGVFDGKSKTFPERILTRLSPLRDHVLSFFAIIVTLRNL